LPYGRVQHFVKGLPLTDQKRYYRGPARASIEADMELDDTHILARRRRRRWVSIVAIVLPVVAAVGVVAWFIRAFVAPPMTRIPSPMIAASVPHAAAPAPIEAKSAAAPTTSPTVPAAEPVEMAAPQPQPPRSRPPPPEPQAEEVPAAIPQVPMIDSLAFAPPTTGFGAPAAPVEAAPNSLTEPPNETAQPVAEPIPMPRRRPRISVAAATGEVPLPRPRPISETAAQDPMRSFLDWLRSR
jgi:hypothetical protein